MVFSSPAPPIDRPWNSSDASTRVISDMRSALIPEGAGWEDAAPPITRVKARQAAASFQRMGRLRQAIG